VRHARGLYAPAEQEDPMGHRPDGQTIGLKAEMLKAEIGRGIFNREVREGTRRK
jgi:hypothetical protein